MRCVYLFVISQFNYFLVSFLPERSPVDAKYKRALEGKILVKDDSVSPAALSSSPRALERRERIYKQIVLEDKSASAKDDFFIAPILYAPSTKRSLQSTPIKVLDAPGLEDDFYQNLLDWDHGSNRLAVLLNGSEVYFWNASNLMSRSTPAAGAGTASLGRLRSSSAAVKACVIGMQGDKLALGCKSGTVEIWDHSRGVMTGSFAGHR